MEEMFGKSHIFTFLDSLKALITKLNTTLTTEITGLNNFEQTQELLRGWKGKCSEEIQSLYAELTPLNEAADKPIYEEFINNCAKEFEKDDHFKEKLCALGEALVDLKETIKTHIQDDISIYKVQA